MQKADLQPTYHASPDHVALDNTMIWINGQQFWLYGAVDPNTNKFLHLWLFSTTATVLTQQFFVEASGETRSQIHVFLVDYAQHLAAALRRAGLRFQTMYHGNRNGFEHVSKKGE